VASLQPERPGGIGHPLAVPREFVEYLLTLERRPPSGDREPLVAVRGKIRNLRTSRETSFRLWLEDDSSIVPVRFEFQPRSFLRLTFEAVKV